MSRKIKDLQEQMERTLAPFFSLNNQPDMSGDPRARLSPLQRRNLTDASRAALQVAAAPLSEALMNCNCRNIGECDGSCTHPAPDPPAVAAQSALAQIDETIFAKGAPLGSDEYFRIRALAAAPVSAEPVAWIDPLDIRMLSNRTAHTVTLFKKEQEGYLSLYAAEPASAPEPVEIKHLEWDGKCAPTVIGDYTILEISDDHFLVALERGNRSSTGSDRYVRIEEAKAAAQADFEARIRSALVTT